MIVETPQGVPYQGKRCKVDKICGVSILRAGETMEQAFSDVCKDTRIGKILIQTNRVTGEPEVNIFYIFAPKFIYDTFSHSHYAIRFPAVLLTFTERY